jgi:hypothetical protein
MVKNAVGKIVSSSKGHTGILYIPANMMVDSAFPFNVPSQVKIIVDDDRIIIEKILEKLS